MDISRRLRGVCISLFSSQGFSFLIHLITKVVLGRLPISDPSRFKDLAYVEFEGNDILDLRRMLENDLHAVQKVIGAFRERIKNASENNDYGTEHMLKGIIFEYEEISDRLEHYLAKESLERSITSD
jgi:Ferritin-like domain